MFISYEELQAMEEKYLEELKNAQSHLEVIRELIKFAEEKEAIKGACEEAEPELEEQETAIDGIEQ